MMDYKTTILNNGVEAKDALLPDIPGLYFGVLSEDKAVFDYTAYIEENKLQVPDYKAFMRLNRHFIEPLAKQSGRKASELFYQNTNGHILIASELVFLCLAFVNPELLGYFNALVSDAISDGVAYSSGFVYSMAAHRLPSEVLNDIIKERQNDTTGN